MPIRAIRAALALLLLAGATAPAQQDPSAASLRVTVIVSDLGAAAARGRLERTVAEAWAVRQRQRGGIFGQEVRVEVRSDASDPTRASRLVQEAADAGAHAVVCCSTSRASDVAARVAAEERILLLSPASAGSAAGEGWQVGLAPSRRASLRAMVRDLYARGLRSIGLFTLEGAYGDAVRDDLQGLIGTETLRLVEDARFAPGAEPLTAEALWLATRVPGAVVVWATRDDTVRAVDALRRRGWTGPVYLPTALTDPLAGGLPSGLRGEVRVPLSPASLPASVPAGDPRASWQADARALGDGRLEARSHDAAGAVMHDALALLAMAFERTATYGVAPSDVARYRTALRDGLVSMSATPLAAGTYHPGEPAAATAEGLVMARLEGGRLVPME
ncbi:MAG: ABC transporter substrate-binding protein [Trueperaceae bacterium]|nr:ABC transporter substrate-binding protein [Trueperaceae bacterium]